MANIEKNCRVCVGADDLKSIFKPGRFCDEILTVEKILNEVLGVEVHKSDGLPEYICLPCLKQLLKSYVFRQNCLKGYEHFGVNPFGKYQDDETLQEYEVTDTEIHEETKFKPECSPAPEQLQILDSNQVVQQVYLIRNNEVLIAQPPEPLAPAEVETETTVTAGYKCEECGKYLRKIGSYKYHMQLHSDETKFECNLCGQKFRTKNTYDGHMMMHEEKHKCAICGKVYRQASSLRSHQISSHNGVKPFKCPHCDKCMTQKSGLKKHLLTHTDIRSYVCEVCQKTFKFSSNYYVHMRTHNQEKEFECDVCGKKFLTKMQLKRHCLIHTGVKPYRCTICHKSFNRKSALNVHLRTHAETRAYQCPNEGCNRAFNQANALNVHLTKCQNSRTD